MSELKNSSLMKLTSISDNQPTEKNPPFMLYFCSIIFPRKEIRHKSGSAYILQMKSPSISWPRLNDQVLFITHKLRLQVHYQTTERKPMKTGFFLQ